MQKNFFGVADITGAFFAGLIIANTEKAEYLQERFNTISYLLLSPVFFASIGLKVVLPKMDSTIVIFSVLLVIVAVVTKIIGCGFGAKICHYKNYQCRRIGVGMISRGEVALIVANKGMALGLLGSVFLGPVIIMVVLTTIVTPVLLKIIFRKGPDLPVPKEQEISSFYENMGEKTVKYRRKSLTAGIEFWIPHILN